jgi:hypothetical protein
VQERAAPVDTFVPLDEGNDTLLPTSDVRKDEAKVQFEVGVHHPQNRAADPPTLSVHLTILLLGLDEGMIHTLVVSKDADSAVR